MSVDHPTEAQAKAVAHIHRARLASVPRFGVPTPDVRLYCLECLSLYPCRTMRALGAKHTSMDRSTP